jgi:hypothetical protein
VPPRRIVDLAREFGEDGFVQSICGDDFGPAIDTLVKRIAEHLQVPALSEPQSRDKAGLVACDVLWLLPLPGAAASTTPVTCDDPRYPFLMSAGKGRAAKGPHGGEVCRQAQLAVTGVNAAKNFQPTDGYSDGWFYDDFSEDVRRTTPSSSGARQRIAFTPAAKPPAGMEVVVDCAP